MLPIGLWRNEENLNKKKCDITHKEWRFMAQQNWPSRCSVKNCDNYCDSISYVYREWDGRVCLVPMCKDCKRYLKRPFELKWVFLLSTDLIVQFKKDICKIRG